MIKFACPHCHAKLSAKSRRSIPKRVKCPKCSETFVPDSNRSDGSKAKRKTRKPKHEEAIPRANTKGRGRHSNRRPAMLIAGLVTALLVIGFFAFRNPEDGDQVAQSDATVTKTESPRRKSKSRKRRSSKPRAKTQDAPAAKTNATKDALNDSRPSPDTSRKPRPPIDPRPSIPPPQLVSFETDRAGYNRIVRPFFQRHCFNCHGTSKQEADLRLDQFEPDFGDLAVAAKWNEVRDRINAGEMPPEDEPQPDSRQLEQVTGWITGELRRSIAARQSTGGQVVLRRLNRVEYRNTIRDLIGIDYDTSEKFPEDPPASGFDNIGSALTSSPLLIETYLRAAREILSEALDEPERLTTHRWRVQVERPADNQVVQIQDMLSGQAVPAKIVGGKDNPVRNGMVSVRRSGNGQRVGVRDIRLPQPGEYIVRVRAAGVVPSRQQVVEGGERKWRQRMEEEIQRNNDPARAAEIRTFWERRLPGYRRHFSEHEIYDYGPPRMKVSDGQTREVLGEIDVVAPPGNPEIYEFRGTFPRGIAVYVGNTYRVPANLSNHWLRYHRDFPAPELLVDWVEIEGPIPDEAAATARQRILSAFGASVLRGSEVERAKTILREFMTRAWRRPVSKQEVAVKLAMFESVRSQKTRFEDALKVPLIVVLSSPNFLFLTEPASREGEAPAEPRHGVVASAGSAGASPSQLLTDHELAARLSYFLWSSMPDDELFQLAADGRLLANESLLQQIDRMLADPKAEQFVRNFAGQWLGLRNVGTNRPSHQLFPRYDDHLEESMVRESEGFFAEILHNDLSVMNFVKSDFVTINARLARFYGIPGVKGDSIRRVAVPRDVPRGGLMTQASVLTVTSNGTRTVPVWRGVWVLENILGERIPPPPPNAGEIPQLTANNRPTTIRARMEQHRQVAACATCHNKIDPLGFALENFRGDGGWATQEANGWGGSIRRDDPVIDASGRLPDGREFNGVTELQRILLREEDRFLRCLTEKLVTYALGRAVEFSDRAWINQLVNGMKSNNYSLRGLIHAIVGSPQFQSK